MPQLTQAVSYLRVSGRGQVDGDGFPRQREAIARFTGAHRYAIVDEFRDEGVSGTRELDDRPGLAALLDRIESNGVRVVIVERADRLARDLMVSEVILAQLAKLGATVLTADGADLTTAADDPTRTLIRQVLGAVAQFDKTVTVLKLRAARDRNSRKAGRRVEGRKGFGAWPGEQGTLDRLLALRQEGWRSGRPFASYATIAAQLNAEGRFTRSGKPWRTGGIEAILDRLKATPRRRRQVPSVSAPPAAAPAAAYVAQMRQRVEVGRATAQAANAAKAKTPPASRPRAGRRAAEATRRLGD